jgi:hypothetical protein
MSKYVCRCMTAKDESPTMQIQYGVIMGEHITTFRRHRLKQNNLNTSTTPRQYNTWGNQKNVEGQAVVLNKSRKTKIEIRDFRFISTCMTCIYAYCVSTCICTLCMLLPPACSWFVSHHNEHLLRQFVNVLFDLFNTTYSQLIRFRNINEKCVCIYTGHLVLPLGTSVILLQ